MLFILLSLCFSEERGNIGEWSQIPVDHEIVKSVKSYLDTNIPHLFPEYEKAQYNIESAKLQSVANGDNLELTIISSSTPLVFVISLYIGKDKTIQLNDISKPAGSKPILGGFMWQNAAHFTPSDLTDAVKLIQRHVNLLIQSEGKVLVYRTKNEKGLKTHLIFKDNLNNVCSAVFFNNVANFSEEFISAYLIF